MRCGAVLIDNLPAVSEAVSSLVVSECNLLRMACYCSGFGGGGRVRGRKTLPFRVRLHTSSVGTCRVGRHAVSVLILCRPTLVHFPRSCRPITPPILPSFGKFCWRFKEVIPVGCDLAYAPLYELSSILSLQTEMCTRNIVNYYLVCHSVCSPQCSIGV